MGEHRERRLAQLQSLQRIGETVAHSESLAEIFDAALAGLLDAVGADRASILLFDADGAMRFHAWRGLSDDYRAAVEGHTPWTPSDADAAPITVPDVTADPSLAAYQPIFAAEGIRAVAFVPLLHQRRVLGKFMLYYDAAHVFDSEEVELAAAIARQIALAVDRQRAGLALRQSERELGAVFDLAASGMALVDSAAGRFLRVNARLCALTGYSAEELLARTFDDVTHPEDREWSRREAFRVLRGETPALNAEKRYVRKDGEVVWVQVSATAIRDGNGRIVHGVFVIQDVTDRRRVEQALRLALARNRAILAAAVDAIITIDKRGTIESLNPAAERMFGFSPAELVGENVRVLMPPPYRDEHDGYLASYLATGNRKVIGLGREVIARRRDGTVFPMELAVSEVMVAGRRSFIGMIRDVTERKAAEDRLLASEARWRLLAKSGASYATSLERAATLDHVVRTVLPELADFAIVHLVEPDGELRQVAQAHVEPEREAVLAAIGDLYVPSRNPRSLLARVLTTGTPVLVDRPQETSTSLELGEKLDELVRQLDANSQLAVPLTARGRTLGTLTLGMGGASRRAFAPEDVPFAEELARRAALAVDNARLYEELRENDQRKDQFLAMLAHELRNPLAAIVTSIEVLEARADEPRMRDRALDILRRQARHMARMTDDLLDVSRFTRGRIELRRQHVELRQLVRQVVGTFSPQVERGGYQLALELPAEEVWVDADAARLEQVVANLLSNALKFTPAGGDIAVELRAAGGQAAIVVRDSGVGIEPRFLPQIFELFAQADRTLARSSGGLGIGLTLVRSLVELHGGRVAAASAGPGEGSAFTVELPAIVPGPVSSPAPAPAPVSAGRRILVVEDGADAADALAEMLRRWGHEVAVAGDAAAALALVPAFGPDVVLLDLGLPGMDGYELAGRLRELPVTTGALLVAVTGYGSDSDRARSAAAGIDQHLVKPVQPDVLRRLFEASTAVPARGKG